MAVHIVNEHQVLARAQIFAKQRDANTCLETIIVEYHDSAGRHTWPDPVEHVTRRFIDVYVDVAEAEAA